MQTKWQARVEEGGSVSLLGRDIVRSRSGGMERDCGEERLLSGDGEEGCRDFDSVDGGEGGETGFGGGPGG